MVKDGIRSGVWWQNGGSQVAGNWMLSATGHAITAIVNSQPSSTFPGLILNPSGLIRSGLNQCGLNQSGNWMLSAAGHAITAIVNSQPSSTFPGLKQSGLD